MVVRHAEHLTFVCRLFRVLLVDVGETLKRVLEALEMTFEDICEASHPGDLLIEVVGEFEETDLHLREWEVSVELGVKSLKPQERLAMISTDHEQPLQGIGGNRRSVKVVSVKRRERKEEGYGVVVVGRKRELLLGDLDGSVPPLKRGTEL